MVIIHTLLSMLGYGDEPYSRHFQDVALDAFAGVLRLNSLDEIIKHHPKHGAYIEAETPFPCAYHLTALAYTQGWRTPENVQLMARAINHINEIMPGDLSQGIINTFVVKVGSSYGGGLWNLTHPFGIYANPNPSGNTLFRRHLTELAMLGVGRHVDVLRVSADNLQEELAEDGVLRIEGYKIPKYAFAYKDIGLEPYPRKKNAALCDATFWAVQLCTSIL